MKTMYYAYYSMYRIQEVQVESETKNFVKRADRNGRDKKETEYGSYHDSRENAIIALKTSLQIDIDLHLRRVKQYESKMNDVVKIYG